MPQRVVSVPNIVQGVTQQPVGLRRPDQSIQLDNCYLRPLFGIEKRNGSDWVGRLHSTASDELKFHKIDRDDTERYIVGLQAGDVKVWDLAGNEYSVEDSAAVGFGYINAVADNLVTTTPEDLSGWTDSGSPTVTPNQADVFGGTGAALYTATGSTWQLDYNPGNIGSKSGESVVLSVYVKAGALSNGARIRLSNLFNLTIYVEWEFDGSGIPSFSSSSAGSATPDSYGEESLGSGWYRLHVTYSAPLSACDPRVSMSNGSVGTEFTLYGARVDVGYTEPQSFLSIQDLQLLTIADTTWVVNPAKTVVDSGSTSPKLSTDPDFDDGSAAYGDVAFIFIRQSAYNTQYNIKVKVTGGSQVTVFGNTAKDSNDSWTDSGFGGPHAPGLKTNAIAEALADELNSGVSNLSADAVGSVIRLWTTAASAKVIEELIVADGAGDTYMVKCHKHVEQLSDLPQICQHGFRIRVAGDKDLDEDDYYLRFIADDGVDAFGNGEWEECLAWSPESGDGYLLGPDPDTMPHILTRKQDDNSGTVTGTAYSIYFEWAQPPWIDRDAGDDTTNPLPYFITQTTNDPDAVERKISNIFYYRNRLGFLLDDRIVLSEFDDVYRFSRSSVTVLLDTHPIDIAPTALEVANFRQAAVLEGSLIVFTDRAQYTLVGEPTLTPSTASIARIQSAEVSESIKPVQTGKTLLFLSEVDGFTRCREMFRVDDSETYDSVDVTLAVPRYIQNPAKEFEISLEENVAFVVPEDSSDLYVYQYLWNVREKVQSAWHRWEFGSDVKLQFAACFDSDLYLVCLYPDGYHLERIPLELDVADSNSDFRVLFDRRITDEDCSVAYAAGPDESTITLPSGYEMEDSGTYRISTRATSSSLGAGTGTAGTKSGTTQYVVDGDWRTTPFWFGRRIQMSYVPTVPGPHESRDDSSALIMSEPKTIVQYIIVEYSDSLRFLMNSQTLDATTYKTGRSELAVDPDGSGVYTKVDGTVRHGVHLDARKAKVSVSNTSGRPVRFQKIEWILNISSRAPRFAG